MNLTAGDSEPGAMSYDAGCATLPASPAPSGPRLRLGAVLSRGTEGCQLRSRGGEVIAYGPRVPAARSPPSWRWMSQGTQPVARL